MKTTTFTLNLSALVFAIGVCSVSAKAAQTSVPPVAPAQHVSTTSDSGPWRRDPFIAGSNKSGARTIPPKTIQLKRATFSQANEQEQDLQLQGIMLVDKAYHALINGRTVKTGDTIGGGIIQHISRYQVVVLNGRKEKVFYDIYQGRIDRGKK